MFQVQFLGWNVKIKYLHTFLSWQTEPLWKWQCVPKNKKNILYGWSHQILEETGPRNFCYLHIKKMWIEQKPAAGHWLAGDMFWPLMKCRASSFSFRRMSAHCVMIYFCFLCVYIVFLCVWLVFDPFQWMMQRKLKTQLATS